MTQCETCNGIGEAIFSCCTGEVLDSDCDLCPTCHEHCGEEECSDCGGTGEIEEDAETTPRNDAMYQADSLGDVLTGK